MSLNAPSVIEAEGLSVKYPDQDELVLDEFQLTIRPGEFVVVAGPSGSGKSTLCRCILGLIPNLTKGEIVSGRMEVCGYDTQTHKVYELAQRVGMVFQDPETNIFSLVVLDELAFGPENMGLDKAEIIGRIEQASEWVGIQSLWADRTDRLSGGQKQRVAVAGMLAMLPQVLVLDEPTTDLDPVGKKQVIETLVRLKRDLGITIVVIEHDLSNLLQVADRLVIVSDSGCVVLQGPPAKLLAERYAEIEKLGMRIPTYARIGHLLMHSGLALPDFPLDDAACIALLREHFERAPQVIHELGLPAAPRPKDDQLPILQTRDLRFKFERSKPVLRGVDLSVRQGEFVAIVGPNGSGKSTLLKLLVGLLKPEAEESIQLYSREGRLLRRKELSQYVSYVFQDPNHQLFENTAWDEVAFGLVVREEQQEIIEERVTEVLQQVNLLHYRDRHPATLSRGEKRRLAVATALCLPIELLLLDEPTTGQDRKTLDGLFSILKRLNEEQGTTVVFVTHDMLTVWNYATSVIGLKDGRVTISGPMQDVLNVRSEGLLAELGLRLPLEARLADFFGGASERHGGARTDQTSNSESVSRCER